LSSESGTWRRSADQIWPRVATIGAVLLLWWGASSSGLFTVFPSPGEVLVAFGDTFVRPDPPRESILAATTASLIRLAVGLGIGIALGTVIGLAMGTSQLVQRSIGSLMAGLQALPSISWLPMAILWFGLTERAILFVVIIASIPAVAIASASSIRLVPPLMVRAGRTLGARGWTLYRRVILPAAVPGYVAGLQSAWALGWRALMAGELISTGGKGLGHLLEANRQRFSAEDIFAVMIMIVIVGMLVEAIFGILDRRIRSKRGLIATA
jgi:NitT/TauT family transport system permease protein